MNQLPQPQACRRRLTIVQLLSRLLLVLVGLALIGPPAARAQQASVSGQASWYGEEHRGKLMANGKPFDPDKMTAASWRYPLGTQLLVTLADPSLPGNSRSIVVTITDRGPARRLLSSGRIIDLSHAAFKSLASPEVGLLQVELRVMPR